MSIMDLVDSQDFSVTMTTLFTMNIGPTVGGQCQMKWHTFAKQKNKFCTPGN